MTAVTYDVFLSYAYPESALGNIVEQQLSDAGLTVFKPWEATAAGEDGDRIWNALIESAALVAVVRSGSVPASIALEFGAAKAWDKEIFVLTDTIGTLDVPNYLKSVKVLPVSRINEVIDSVRDRSRPFDDDQRAALARIYARMRTPVDQLLTQPGAMDLLARDFQRATGHTAAIERVARELIRLKKLGGLARKLGPPARTRG